MSFFQSKQWIVLRRIVLVVVLLVAAYRSYGDSVRDWFAGPDPSRDILITSAEFRTDLGGERPIWFIGLKNMSSKTSYKRITLEATYFDALGAITETDRIVIDQTLEPGQEHQLGSTDPRSRAGAVDATLQVRDAEVGP